MRFSNTITLTTSFNFENVSFSRNLFKSIWLLNAIFFCFFSNMYACEIPSIPYGFSRKTYKAWKWIRKKEKRKIFSISDKLFKSFKWRIFDTTIEWKNYFLNKILGRNGTRAIESNRICIKKKLTMAVLCCFNQKNVLLSVENWYWKLFRLFIWW